MGSNSISPRRSIYMKKKVLITCAVVLGGVVVAGTFGNVGSIAVNPAGT